MIYTLYSPSAGGYFTSSRISLMLSTPLFEAASISMITPAATKSAKRINTTLEMTYKVSELSFMNMVTFLACPTSTTQVMAIHALLTSTT